MSFLRNNARRRSLLQRRRRDSNKRFTLKANRVIALTKRKISSRPQPVTMLTWPKELSIIKVISIRPMRF